MPVSVLWTGPELHITIVDWTLIKDAASAKRFAGLEAGNELALGEPRQR